MSNNLSSSDLEQLFLEKLQLKYQLTERDLKKAFSRFDKDCNGSLDIKEISIAVRLMLNGVTDEQIRNLVKRFDFNGDGKITYDEFLSYLLSRSNTASKSGASSTRSPRLDGSSAQIRKPDEVINYRRAGAISNARDDRGIEQFRDKELQRQHPDVRRSGSSKVQQSDNDRDIRYYNDQDSVIDEEDDNGNEDYDDFPDTSKDESTERFLRKVPKQVMDKQRPNSASSEAPSDIGSSFDPSNAAELEYRCKTFLENLRSYLNKRVVTMRVKGDLPHHLTMSSRELLEKTGCMLLSKSFQIYTGADSGRARARKEDQLVELGDFMRVLRSFKFPGFPAVRSEVLHYLFELCRHSPPGAASSKQSTARWDLDNGQDGAADTDLLCDLVYGESMHSIRHQQLPRQQGPAAVGEQAGQRVKDQDTLKSYSDRANINRTNVARGPFKPTQGPTGAMDKEGALAAIPLRFLSRKTFTSLAAPSNFDMSLLKRSMTIPAVECVREHVFGLSHSVTGTPIYALSPQPQNSSFGSTGRGSSSSADGRSKADATSRGEYIKRGGTSSNTNTNLVYASAALGVVHDLATNQQTLFAGHDDDITCIALSNRGALAATGQTGKNPVVHIWNTAPTPRRSKDTKPVNSAADGECDGVLTVGLGFFSRGVCAVSFSSDDAYLAAIGCDDHHSMGIWSVPAGVLLVQTVCQNGLPPQIKDLKWSPGQQFSEFISRELKGPCDLLCTAGERHLRVWSFSRPKSGQGAAVVGGIAVGPQPASPCSLMYKAAVMGKSKATAAKVYTCCSFIPCDEKGDKTYDMVAGGSNGVVYLFRAGELAAFTNAIKGGILCLHVSASAGDKVFCGGARGVVKVLDARTLSTVASFSTKMTVTATVTAPSRVECWSANSAVGAARRGSASQTARPSSASSARSAVRATSTGRLRTPSVSAAATTQVGSIINHTPASSAVAAVLADVTGIAVVHGIGRSSASQSLAQAQSLYVIATCSDGRAVRMDVGGALSSSSGGGKGRAGAGTSGGDDTASAPAKDIFYFHTSSVWGLATERRAGGSLVATVGEDKQLCVWDTDGYYLSCRLTMAAAAHCCHFDKYSNFIAVGSTVGGVTVYSHLAESAPSSSSPVLRECAFRKDLKEEISDIKFSPSNTRLAVGSHDDLIIIYSCLLTVDDSRSNSSGSCVLRPLHKLKGHSAYITHIDWSSDSQLLRSTCGAYELLFWDVEAGKRFFDSNSSDVRWKSNTCTLGFQVMGIWPKYADGTDINALDVCNEQGIVATADDSGFLNILNFPSVVEEAPRRMYSGHSSFVQNVRFLPPPVQSGSGLEQRLMTVGGDDCAVITWSLKPASLLDPRSRTLTRSLN